MSPNDSLLRQLRRGTEVELSVKGRKSGKVSSRPVWFVISKDERSMFLIPVNGRRTQWYLNVKKEPKITANVGGEIFTGTASEVPAGQFRQVLDAFTAKYGKNDMEQYYPKLEVALVVPLPSGGPTSTVF